jgi:hypothetical protein
MATIIKILERLVFSELLSLSIMFTASLLKALRFLLSSYELHYENYMYPKFS